MARLFPRSVESSIKVLQTICEDPKNPAPMRVRCAELILASYGIVALNPDQKPRHQGLKQIESVLELSGTDRKIAGKVRAERREQITKLKQELETL